MNSTTEQYRPAGVCGYCRAADGQPCRTRTGRIARLHNGRAVQVVRQLEDETPATGTPCSRCGRDAADPVHAGRRGHAFDVAATTVQLIDQLQDLIVETDHADALLVDAQRAILRHGVPMWWAGFVHISMDAGRTALCGVERTDPHPAVIATRPGCGRCLAIAEAGGVRPALERDHADALTEDAAHDAAVAVAVEPDLYLAANELADRLVQGVPMFEDRDLAAQPLTDQETERVQLATRLAQQKLRAQPARLPRALRYGRRSLVTPQ